MKKNLFILTMLLCIAVIPEAFAYNFQSGGIYYDITGTSPNTVAVTYATGSYNSYSGNVDIPSTVTYNGTTYTVTGIGNNAFRNCSNLTGVTIPGTVTSIGEYAFYSCGRLHSVTFPTNLTTIGANAFYYSGLYSVTIPAAVTSIGSTAFRQCSSLRSANFYASNCTSAPSIFYDCSHLDTLTIGSNVHNLPSSVFSNLSALKKVHIPNSVTSMGNNPFAYCPNLDTIVVAAGNSVFSSGNHSSYIVNTSTHTLVTGCKRTVIPNSVTHIGGYAFSGCTGLTGALTIPNSVTHIGWYAFSGCTGLTGALTIPNQITIIGACAYSGCSGLTSLTIGHGVDSIGNSAFSSCSSISSVSFNADSCRYMASSAGLSGCSSFSTLLIGNNVKAIPAEAFRSCNHLTGMLVIPNSVKHIGNSAFYGCNGLTSLSLGNSVTSIGSDAFYNCSNMGGTLTIPQSVKTIVSSAFYYCTSFSAIVFNADSCTIGSFSGCSNVTSLTIGNNVKVIPASAFSGLSQISGVLTIPNSVLTIGNNAFSNCSGLNGALTIPDSVLTIDNHAFSNCGGLTSLTIGNAVSTIGSDAFSNCSGLTSVVFNADSCVFMGSAFSGCTGPATLTIGENVKVIPSYAFKGLGLTDTLVIPDSVVTIGNDAFENCSRLTSLTIGNAVSTIGAYAYSGCSGLTSLTIGNAVSTIGSNAFSNCSGLTSLTIGNAVSTIGSNAFSNCSGLISLTIGNAVSTIESNAFSNCSGLTSVVFNADSCTTMGNYYANGVFSGCTGPATLTIGENVKVIPSYAFKGLGLTDTIVIPHSVITIGNFAFQNCTSLNAVTFNADSCTTMGTSSNNSAFNGCTNISSLSIGENVKNIPAYAFYGLNHITGALTIPDSVVFIGGYAFNGCSGYTSLSLGRSVDTIGQRAFPGNIASIYSYRETPPAIKKTASYHSFYSVSRNTPVYVPCGSAQAYRNAWPYSTNNTASYFYNIYETLQTYLLTTLPEDTLKGAVQITTQPTCTESPVIEATPNFFYVFDHWSDGNTDNPRTIELTQDTTLVAYFREYTITLASSDSSVGIATTVVTPTVDNPQAIVEAVVMDSCYVFAGWSDGSMENPHTISLTQDTALTASFNLVINVQIYAPSAICTGDSITLAAAGADSYLWFNGDTTSHIKILPENSLEVSVTGTGNNGCSASAAHSVNVLPKPAISISGLTDICEGESAILTATSSNPTEELLLFEDFEEGIDGWYTMDFDGDGYNWYSTVGNNNQNGYESDGAAASASYINGEGALSPNNMLYTSVHIPITGAQLSWYAAAQNPNWPAEHYEVWVYTQSMGYVGWSSTSIFSETLTDGEWRHHTVDLNDWAGEDILIGFVHANCSDQYVLKIDNVRIVTVISDTYVWSNGHADNQLSVNNAGSYYVTATKPNGCSSTDSVTITVWQPDTVDITINSPNNYYVMNDETFCTSGDYTQTLQNIHGCDSVINLHLTLAPRDTVFITDTVCRGRHEIYWNNSSYDTTYSVYFNGIFDETIYSIAGYGGWEEAIVYDDLYGSEYEGLIYGFHVSGEYYQNDSLWIQYDETRTLQAVSGCDSVVKKHHYVKFSDWYSLRDTACGSYVWQGDTITANPNNLNRWLYAESTNAQGCYSSVELRLTLLPAIEESVTITACDSYVWNGTTYTESGVYTYNTDTTLQETPACKLTTLHLTINPSVTNLVEATACDSYSWNDSTYTTSGEYIQTFTAANGCDSIVTLQLTVNPSVAEVVEVSACDSYTWNETTYTSSGEYTQTFTAANGCDSIVTLQLTILPLPTPNITGVTTVCEGQTATLNATGGVSYLWEDGTTTNTYPVTVSGLYTVTVTNAEGCSATASSTVTVNPLPEVAITGNTAICPGGSTVLTATGADSYVWSNGSTNPSIPVNAFGQYSVIGTSAEGCFSTASVTVLVSQPPVITISGNTDICAGESTTLTANGGVSYMWSNGSTDSAITVNTAGNWQVIGYNENNCSNMASVTVNVWQPAATDLYITSFDSCYTWFGTPRCESGDYTHTLQTIHGCDSVITLHLTLEDAIVTEFSATACDNYTWNGATYSQSGNYTQSFTAVNGNDSIVTLHLTINTSKQMAFADSTCTAYVWNGQTYTASGDYIQTFTAVNGCDSTVTLHLTIHQPAASEFTVSCPDSCYTWNSQTYCASGDYTQTLQTVHGCDSVVTLHLTITVGIEDHNLGASMTVYPNPTTSVVNVQCTMNNVHEGTVEFQLFDAFGRLLRTTDGVETQNFASLQTARIDLSHYAAGVYFVKALADGNVVAVRKVVKR